MKRVFCIVLSLATAYMITLAFWHWERKYSCTIAACGPDDSGTIMFGVSFAACYYLSSKGTRLK